MTFLTALCIALTAACAGSAAVLAEVPTIPAPAGGAVQQQLPPGAAPGEVFVAPATRWDSWCTCKCGDLYHRMDVPTPSCAELNGKECVLGGRKYVLEDCGRRLTPNVDRLPARVHE